MAKELLSPDIIEFDRLRTEPMEDTPRRLSNSLRVVSTPALDASETADASLAENWGRLIDEIRSAAARLRDGEARLQQREELVQALAQRSRDEMQAASDRARRAEAHAQDVEAQSRLEIAAWEKRTVAAEGKVREMEGWLTRVRETLMTEFG